MTHEASRTVGVAGVDGPVGPARGAEPTVLASWTATVVRALDAQGLPGADLAREAGIDPAALRAGGGRVPLSCSTRLWRLAVDATGDPCFGIEVSRFVGPGTFHGLGVGILASTSLQEAFQRITRFAPVVLAMPQRAEAEERQGRYELRLDHRPDRPGGHGKEPTHESVEAVVASIVRTARFLTRTRLSPLAVALRRPRRPAADRFEAFFGCPVTYGAEAYVLAFDPVDVHRPLPTSCVEAALAADTAVADYLDRVRPVRQATDAAREAVADLLDRGEATPAAVAARLAMSERTLQRRLHAEGTSLREVVSDVRIDLAQQLLRAGGMTVEQVAARLRFSDTATFRRAFKRRTGTTPGLLVAPGRGPAAPAPR